MAPKHHPTPLSGGDRKALNKDDAGRGGETWMTASADEALKLQRPLPDGSLRIVARGVKEDPVELAT